MPLYVTPADIDDAEPRRTLPCGHATRHGQRIGCCALCGVLFASDSAFAAHIKRGMHLPPADVGLVARPSRTAPGETVWGGAGSFDYDDDPSDCEPDWALEIPDDDASHAEEERRHSAIRWSQAEAL